MPCVKVGYGVVIARAPSADNRAGNSTVAVLTCTLSIRSKIERFAESVAEIELETICHWVAQLDLARIVTAVSIGIPNDQRSILGCKKALRLLRGTAACGGAKYIQVPNVECLIPGERLPHVVDVLGRGQTTHGGPRPFMFKVGYRRNIRGARIHLLGELGCGGIVIRAGSGIEQIQRLPPVVLLHQVPSETTDIRDVENKTSLQLPLKRCIEGKGIRGCDVVIDSDRVLIVHTC